MSKERTEATLNRQDIKEQSDLVCKREIMQNGQSKSGASRSSPEKTAGQTAIASCVLALFTLLLAVVFLLAVSLPRAPGSVSPDTKWHNSQRSGFLFSYSHFLQRPPPPVTSEQTPDSPSKD